MKKILVPTDFSANSNNALEFAIELNKKFIAEIMLFHSYFIPIPATEIPVAMPSDLLIRKAAGETLNNTRDKYQKLFPSMNFTANLNEGFADIEIIEMEKKIKADLIVLGTHGSNALKKFLIGSNTSTVIEKATCPVIAVPEAARMKGLKKIVFAANYAEDDFKNVFDLIEFAGKFDAEVVLLHVSSGHTDRTFEYNELNGFKDQIISESGYQNVSFKLFEDKDVYEGLNIYLDEIKADMLSISMRNRSFLKKIFQPSLTRKMVYHTHLPVMVFHTEV